MLQKYYIDSLIINYQPNSKWKTEIVTQFRLTQLAAHNWLNIQLMMVSIDFTRTTAKVLDLRSSASALPVAPHGSLRWQTWAKKNIECKSSMLMLKFRHCPMLTTTTVPSAKDPLRTSQQKWLGADTNFAPSASIIGSLTVRSQSVQFVEQSNPLHHLSMKNYPLKKKVTTTAAAATTTEARSAKIIGKIN